MARVRFIEIRNFRSIKEFNWAPGHGLNCLIGPGDTGKSTVLDAVELALAVRSSIAFSDTDFYQLDVTQPIVITVTLGDLPAHLMDVDHFGEVLRGFDPINVKLADEPGLDLETVLSVQLQVDADLDPRWRLYSDRTATADPPKTLGWTARNLLVPMRLGGHPSSNLSWARGSVLNKLSEERADISAELAKAARDARAGFGETASVQLKTTLDTVTQTAKDLGVTVGAQTRALLDVHAVAFGEGSVSLHNEAGIPLRSLGSGSKRLLLAGLHRQAAERTPITLVDEVEFGLEPHRLTRLLHSLGSKAKNPPLQVFMTTHSPVTVRELSGDQLHVLRQSGGKHSAKAAGTSDAIQSTLRLDPEAFLAYTVYVCEGASEVGLLRGFDLWTSAQWPDKSLHALGSAFVDTGGGSPDKCLMRAKAIAELGYRVVAFIDNDSTPTPAAVKALQDAGGTIVTWAPGLALEDVLFTAFSDEVVDKLIDRALEVAGRDTVNQTLAKAASGQNITIEAIQAARTAAGRYSEDQRRLLGAAARTRRQGWFKSITKMEGVARDILAPNWEAAAESFTTVIKALWKQASAPHA